MHFDRLEIMSFTDFAHLMLFRAILKANAIFKTHFVGSFTATQRKIAGVGKIAQTLG